MSELGSYKNLRHFRFILWLCGPLFAITVLFYIAPRIGHAGVSALFLAVVALEILVGVVPPIGKRNKKLHEAIAYSMGFLMLVSGGLFAIILPRCNMLE